MIQNDSISIVIIGAAGQGKSSLINLLVGKEIAKVGDDLDGVTKDISEYRAQIG